MFFKRSLVMTVGVLLFIVAFLLRSNLSEKHLENTFKGERTKFGVEGADLTLPEAAPPAPIIAPAAVTPASAPATASAAASSDSDSSSSSSSTAPGSTTDPNMLIGPAAPTPSGAPAPASAPDSNTVPATTPDTNSGPMNPVPSTMNRTRSPLRMALVSRVLAIELGQTNSGGPSMDLRSDDTTATPMKAKPVTMTSSKAETTAAPAKVKSIQEPTPEQAISSSTHGGRAIILGYHQFTGPGIPSRNQYSMSQDVFESEMKYLHDNNYNVVPLSDVVAFVEHKKELPPNAVAITIDDGYKSALVWAAPVLKKYGYTWTYFVYPSFITRTEGKGAASWPDLVELDREGIDVECHSMTHPQMNKKLQDWPMGSRHAHLLSDAEYADFLTNETATAKAILEKELNKKIKYFAYPYGAYNSKVEAAVRAAGFEAVFTVAGNPIHITTLPYRMGRYIITKPVEHEFAAYLHQGALGLVDATPEPGAIVTNPKPVISAVLDFQGDPATLETDVRDYGVVKHDFDPETSTLRLYLPRPLVQPEVVVNIRQEDPKSGQVRVANWSFNYEASGSAAVIHPAIDTHPIGQGESAPATNAPTPSPAPETNATEPVPAPATAVSPPPATNAAPAGP